MARLSPFNILMLLVFTIIIILFIILGIVANVDSLRQKIREQLNKS